MELQILVAEVAEVLVVFLQEISHKAVLAAPAS